MDNGTTISGFNAGAIAGAFGTGLAGSTTYLLGTITFHKTGAGSSLNVSAFLGNDDNVLGVGGVPGAILCSGPGDQSQCTLGSATLSNVPEPGTVSLLALGLAGLALAGHRKT